MPAIPPREILYKEANARFWAQTGYKPGQKLNKDIAGDRAMMPAWMAALHEVEREAKAGKLVLTYDHPGVQQGLADAAVADQAAAMHLDAASKAPDAATAQQNVAAATVATQVSAQKTREAASVQPPSIPPQVTNAASAEAARTPPPPHAPPAEHIAHARTQAPYSPRDVLIQETNVRFWAITGYKPGEKLDMSNPTDRKMSKKWLSVFRQVQHEAATGRLALSPPHAPPSYVPPPVAQPSYVPPPAAQPSYVPPSAAQPSYVPPSTSSAPPDVAWPPPQVPTGPTGAHDTAIDTSAEPPPPEDKPFPIGKVLAIAAALAAAGGLAYMAMRKPERTPSRPRARSPKVFVATPARVSRAVPTRAMRTPPVRGLLPAGPSSRSVRP